MPVLIAKYGTGTGETDRERLVRHLADQGAELLRMEPIWEPGLLSANQKTGRQGGYIYRISYVDAQDRCHFAECETSVTMGVVLRRDGVKYDADD